MGWQHVVVISLVGMQVRLDVMRAVLGYFLVVIGIIVIVRRIQSDQCRSHDTIVLELDRKQIVLSLVLQHRPECNASVYLRSKHEIDDSRRSTAPCHVGMPLLPFAVLSSRDYPRDRLYRWFASKDAGQRRTIDH